MTDFRIKCNQGSDYIIEADTPDQALELFDTIRQERHLDLLKDFQILGVEEVGEERSVREYKGMMIR